MNSRIKLIIAGGLAALALELGGALPAQASTPSSEVVAGCYGVHGRLVCNGRSVPRTWRYYCAYISRTDLEITGWQMILDGGVVSSAGLFADGTVVGLPLGAVIGLVGLWEGVGGGFVIWYADNGFQPGWRCAWVLSYA